MAKSYLSTCMSLLLLALGSCQSIEQISIDYMKPGELTFPPQLRKVAVVNNTNTVPDNKLLTEAIKPKENMQEVSRATAYANGDPKIATESLAKEIAAQNYFDVVVICDSALRANDRFHRENTLSQEEVKQLAAGLDVDLIVALENIQLKATKTVTYLPEFGCFRAAVDVKAHPLIKIYLPGRSKPMSTLYPNDSIFWEEFGGTLQETVARMTPDAQILKEGAEFAGSVPLKQLLPHWTKGKRYLYTGGSVNMRDATIFVREENWSKAYQLWQQLFDSSKSAKKKMQTAHNIALYYEMTDSLAQAEEWATKAQELAKKVDKVGDNPQKGEISLNDIPNYYLATLYATELKERNSQMLKLKMQMNRFNDDF